MAIFGISSKIITSKFTISLLFIVGLVLKLIFFDVQTGDYVHYFKPWIFYINSHNYWHSLADNFYSYTPSYIYILVLITKIGLNPLYAVKIVSILFEYIAGFYIGRILFEKYKTVSIIWLSMAIFPLIPSVLLNSSYLSQSDSIYTAFSIASIYYLMVNKSLRAVILFAIALNFKLQTIFLLPLFFVFMLKRKVKWYYFFLLPIIYIISILPAWYFGRPFIDLLLVYLSQANYFLLLTMEFPNLYIWISNDYYEIASKLGMAVTFFTVLIFGIWLSRQKGSFTNENIIRIGFLFSLLIPFLLPGMHERYLYLGDSFALLYLAVFRKKFYYSFGIWSVSLYSYIRCSRFNDILPMFPAFFVYLSIIVLLALELFRNLKDEQKNFNKSY